MRHYNSAIANEMKRNFILEKLLEKGITESQQGTSVYLLDYQSLKNELALSNYREIDVESSENKWF